MIKNIIFDFGNVLLEWNEDKVVKIRPIKIYRTKKLKFSSYGILYHEKT